MLQDEDAEAERVKQERVQAYEDKKAKSWSTWLHLQPVLYFIYFGYFFFFILFCL